MITLDINGRGGSGTLQVETATWRAMSALSRVLYIHEHARQWTLGLPFEVFTIERQAD